MRVLIVDDEASARDRLRRLLSSREDVKVVGEAADGLEALELCRSTEPDLVLLDVEMPELDGMGVAEALPESGPAVVFVTAYDAYALHAFEQAAHDYLVKPVTPARLGTALDRVRLRATSRSATTPKRMAFKSGADYVVLDPAEIAWVRAEGPVTELHAGGRARLCDETMSELERRLQSRGFFRAHRSSLVNLAWVVGLERQGERRHVVVLGDSEGTRVVVSRDRVAALKARLGG